jgi:hypothetical protein
VRQNASPNIHESAWPQSPAVAKPRQGLASAIRRQKFATAYLPSPTLPIRKVKLVWSFVFDDVDA